MSSAASLYWAKHSTDSGFIEDLVCSIIFECFFLNEGFSMFCLARKNYHNRPGSWAGLHRMKVPSIPFPSYICALSSHSEVQPEVSAEFLLEFQAKKLVKGSRDKIISGRWEHNHKKTLFCHSRLQALLFSLFKLLFNSTICLSPFPSSKINHVLSI